MEYGKITASETNPGNVKAVYASGKKGKVSCCLEADRRKPSFQESADHFGVLVDGG